MQRVALVTGCSSGVGLYTAVHLAKQGLRVFASMRDLTKSAALTNAAQAAGVKVELLRLDVQHEAQVEAAVGDILAVAGRLDVLVNNAGVGMLRAMEEMSEAEIKQVFDVNYFGVVRCIRAVLPTMRAAESGHIVSVSSVGGLVGQPLNEVYCGAKFALEGMVESLATYMEPFFNIKFTIIEPAGIKSEFVNNAMGGGFKSAASSTGAYAPVYKAYTDTIAARGSFETLAQTSEQVAEIIVAGIVNPGPELRIQTSAVAKAFAAEKLSGDPDGTSLQRKVRIGTLGLRG